MHEQICNCKKEYIYVYVCVKERSNIIVVSFPVCFINRFSKSAKTNVSEN